MVRDAEKYKAEDDAIRSKIESKNGLESYCYSMKNTMNDEKLKDKINENDKKTIIDKFENKTEVIVDDEGNIINVKNIEFITKKYTDEKGNTVENGIAKIKDDAFKQMQEEAKNS
jgi:molecular chaperone DnaK (HSP70)